MTMASTDGQAMFFVVSKLFWLVAQPISICALLVLAGGVLVAWHRVRWGLALGGLGLSVLVVSGYTTLGTLLIGPLENRFERPAQMPVSVSTIIVLGGSTVGRVSGARGISELNEAGDRLVAAVYLAQTYPAARIVLSGGTGLLTQGVEAEAVTSARLLADLGVPADRLVLETASRNTIENADLTRVMLGEVNGAIMLVTSAFHMPRSVALFEKAGLEVIAWPTDYRSTGAEGFGLDLANPVYNFSNTSVAIREWVGLLVYAAIGRIDTVFPGPSV
ncbi:YdcF family protein, partial [Devosia sp.]